MNLNIFQAVVLALLQGVTELFPISSLGHTVILPGLLGWGDLQTNTGCGGESCFLPFITSLHLGTSIALLIYFWRDWFQVGRTLVTSIKEGEIRKGTEEWVSWLIIVGCLPAGLLGVFLETPLKKFFASPLLAATLLTFRYYYCSWPGSTPHSRRRRALLLFVGNTYYLCCWCAGSSTLVWPIQLCSVLDLYWCGSLWRCCLPEYQISDEVL